MFQILSINDNNLSNTITCDLCDLQGLIDRSQSIVFSLKNSVYEFKPGYTEVKTLRPGLGCASVLFRSDNKGQTAVFNSKER